MPRFRSFHVPARLRGAFRDREPGAFARRGLVLLAFLAIGQVLTAPSAQAQIVNTLRGFEDDESGWSGELAGSFSQSGGNTDVLTLGADGAVQWQNELQRVRLLGSTIRSETDGDLDQEASMGHLRHNYRLLPWAATLAFAQLQDNRFQRLKSRLLLGAGFRFDVVRRETWDLSIGLAHMYEREEIDGARGTDVDQRLSTFVSWSGDPRDGLEVDLSGFYQPLWNDLADARATGTTEVTIRLVGAVSLGLSAAVQHDSEPPEGVEQTDWSYLTKIVLEL